MRQGIYILTLLLLSSGTAAEAEATKAPDWQLRTAAGQTVSLSDSVDRQTSIVFFWATWCPFCKALMPHLQSIKMEYGEHVEVLAISVFDDGDPARFVEENGYDFTVLLDGDKVAEKYGITGTPGLLIVDRSQLVQFDLRGLPALDNPLLETSSSNRRKAGILAPYWAAATRRYLDTVLSDPGNLAASE